MVSTALRRICGEDVALQHGMAAYSERQLQGSLRGMEAITFVPQGNHPPSTRDLQPNNYNDLVRSGDNQSELINDDMSVVTNAKSTLNLKLSSGDITSGSVYTTTRKAYVLAARGGHRDIALRNARSSHDQAPTLDTLKCALLRLQRLTGSWITSQTGCRGTLFHRVTRTSWH